MVDEWDFTARKPAMSYSMDLRLRVVAAVEAGASMWSVAQRFDVAHPTVRAWRDRAREGRLEPDKPARPRLRRSATPSATPCGPWASTHAATTSRRADIEEC